jgi:multicomponent K+:H+ antiporter subunit E
MSVLQRTLPSPRLSIVIVVLWLAISNSLHPGHIAVALVLALVLPMFTQHIVPSVPRIRAPLKLIAYVLLVLQDICIANFRVARLALSPLRYLHPMIVRVPLDVKDPAVATILAATVTLTPGTVSVELDMNAAELTVHALDAQDAHAVVTEIKQRYEARLKEIFEC